MLFPGAAPALAAHGLAGLETGIAVQPATEESAAREFDGVARKMQENDLRDVLGQVCVPADKPERRGLDEINITSHQLAKRGF
jgi:hypothetical protein